jgi:hypothetical protein
VLSAIAGGFGVPFAIVISGLFRLPSLLLYRRATKKGTVGTLAPVEIELALHLEDETAGCPAREVEAWGVVHR